MPYTYIILFYTSRNTYFLILVYYFVIITTNNILNFLMTILLKFNLKKYIPIVLDNSYRFKK